MLLLPAALATGVACAPAERSGWRGRTWTMVRCEATRAIVDFDPEGLSAAERDEFVELVDRGIADLERMVAPGLAGPPASERLRYVVSARVGMSRTFGRTILLPLERVKSRRAPYLHETVHALVPTHHGSSWLSEGLASYLESWAAENGTGYDAHVFTRAGDRGIHEAARRVLATNEGRSVLRWIAGPGEPPEMSRDRWGVARPFYVLAQSFTKHLVDRLGLSAVVGLDAGDDPEGDLERRSGRSAVLWRADWLASLGSR
jgi:hypothetical protein